MPARDWRGHSASFTRLALGVALGDPSTSYRWGQRLAQSPRSATLLTYDGMGHTVFGRLMDNGSDCTDQWIDGYLISQAVPPVGTVCPADVPPAAG